MGDAYTPGLTVTRSTVVRKARRLPIAGTVVVEVGARVTASDVVARTDLPGRVHLANLANQLGVLPDEIAGNLRVQPGGSVDKGQLVGEARSFFGLIRSRAEAPVGGTFESFSEVTGMGVFREPPIPVEVTAYVDGTIVEVIEHEGVVVEARGALIQGIFGLAGERTAPLVQVATAPDQLLDAEHITPDHAGKVIVGGARATLAALRRAIEVGAAGVVCGGFAYQDVKELLGYDVGVAITGTESLPTTLVVTEGFGDIAMARATFDLLASLDGRRASITGATQIRAGVIRPEVMVPEIEATASAHAVEHKGLEIGAPVRCIRAPYFGRIGTVSALPVELHTLPSETKVRVLEVDLGDERILVPRANVEVIER